MADETLAIRHDEIGAVDTAKLAHGTRGIVLLDTDGNTKAATPREVTDAAGDVTLGGVLSGAAKVGNTINASINNGAITLNKLASQTPDRLIGVDSSGNVTLVTVGTNLSLAGNNVSGITPATADPFTVALIRLHGHGF